MPQELIGQPMNGAPCQEMSRDPTAIVIGDDIYVSY
jgi:hypothetical protein